MAVSPRLSMATVTSGSWRSFIYKHSVPSWVSDGRTKSPILKSWTESNQQPPSKCCCWKPSCTGLTTSSWMGDEYIAKTAALWWTSTRTKKTRLATWKCYKDSLKSSLKLCGIKPSEFNIAGQGLAPPLECTHVHSKCITGKRVMSRIACSPQLSPQSCFCPCHNIGLPVSHLPPTLQIQTGVAEPFQSPLTGAQTKSSLNPRDNHHWCPTELHVQSFM